MVGFKEVIGSWKIIAISFPRMDCISRSLFSKRFSPLNRIEPSLTIALFDNNCITLLAVTLFPDPDSPTKARVSPFCKVRLTPRIACTSPAKVLKWIRKFSIDKIVSLIRILLIFHFRVKCITKPVC